MASARKTTVVWHGPKVEAKLQAAIASGLTAAAAVGADAAVRNFQRLGIAGRANSLKTRRPVYAKGRKQWIPSRPGEYPGVRTGNLRNSIAFVSPAQFDGRRAAFGTAVKYGRYLETGTSKMAPRPWLRRSAAVAAPRMRNAFVRTVRTQMGVK